MKKKLKKISLLILSVLILTIIYGVINNSIFTKNRLHSSDYGLVKSIAAPPLHVVAEINKIERDKSNNANLIISTSSFFFEQEQLNEDLELIEPLRILIRDNMSVIEDIIKVGMKLRFETDSYRIASGYVDLTPQHSTISIISEDDTLVAETKLLTTLLKGQQSFINLSNLPSIVTVGEEVDCMSKNVCHPELYLESIINNQVEFNKLKRGEKLDISIPDIDEIYLTDVHTYKKYKNNPYSKYMRSEFLVIFSEDYEKNVSDDEQPSMYIPLADPYCEINFNESLNGFDKNCGVRSKVWFLLGWFRELLNDDHEGYVVC